jgi:hypothetical protein
MIDRRQFITGAAGLTAALGAGQLIGRCAWAQPAAPPSSLPFGNGERPVVQYPQKRPMIRLTERPPQLEAPFSVFDEGPITVIDTELDSFWMKTAYRIPDNECACVPAGGKPDRTRPIGRLDVRSFITNLADQARVKAGAATTVRGIAFDGGHGIKEVGLSIDGGKTWKPTQLGRDLGKYSFRPWQTTVVLPAGAQTLMVRATSKSGEVQPMEARWNPSGYMRNLVETTRVEAA